MKVTGGGSLRSRVPRRSEVPIRDTVVTAKREEKGEN